MNLDAPTTSYADILQRLVRRYMFKLERQKEEGWRLRCVKLKFHGTDTDTDTDFLADFRARISVGEEVRVGVGVRVRVGPVEFKLYRRLLRRLTDCQL